MQDTLMPIDTMDLCGSLQDLLGVSTARLTPAQAQRKGLVQPVLAKDVTVRMLNFRVEKACSCCGYQGWWLLFGDGGRRTEVACHRCLAKVLDRVLDRMVIDRTEEFQGAVINLIGLTR